MNRGLIIALALSIAANMLLGGFIAGKIAGGPGHDARHGGEGRHGGHHDFDDLTPTARDALRRAFEERRARNAGEHRAMEELKRELVAVISAEKFDRAAATAVVEKFGAADTSFRADMASIMIDAADGLSLEDRRALARHLERKMARGDRMRRRRGEARDGAPPETPPSP